MRSYVSRIILILVLLTCFLEIGKAQAYKVQPLLFRLAMKRGETKVLSIIVMNTEKSTHNFLAYKTNFMINRKGANIFPKMGDKYSCLSSIELKENKFSLLPSARKEIKFKIKIPYSFKPGEYYGAIMVDLLEPITMRRGIFETDRYSAQASLIILNIHSRKIIKKKAKISELNVAMPDREKVKFFTMLTDDITKDGIITERIAKVLNEKGYRFPYGEYVAEKEEIKKEIASSMFRYFNVLRDKEKTIKIKVTLKNESQISIGAEGEAYIIGKNDRKIYDKFPLLAEQSGTQGVRGKVLIYPEGIRDYLGEIARPLPAGKYEVKISFDYDVKYRKVRTKTEFTITREIAVSLKELLTLAVGKEFLEFEFKPGGMIMKGLEIINLDFQPLRVAISTLPEKMSWLGIAQTELNLRAGEDRKIRFRIKIPRDEKVERSAKIVLTPERGKPIIINLIIKEVVNPKNQ